MVQRVLVFLQTLCINVETFFDQNILIHELSAIRSIAYFFKRYPVYLPEGGAASQYSVFIGQKMGNRSMFRALFDLESDPDPHPNKNL